MELVPDLELLIGEQPQVPELPPKERLNRFTFVFQSFMRVFASVEHPLVLLVDDLQWADAPSLDLLEHLVTDPGMGYLLVIGAYRDNEVPPGQPLLPRPVPRVAPRRRTDLLRCTADVLVLGHGCHR